MDLLVKAERNYIVKIEDDFNDLLSSLEIFSEKQKVLIITDQTIKNIYLDEFEKIIRSKFRNTYTHVIKSGEKSKNIKEYINIVNTLVKNEFTRHDYIISFGGGVVGDLSAFVSSTFKRGIKFIQIPTTLLAMVDSSIGGKTAIDFLMNKNVIGTFYSPFLVYCNLSLLKSLDKKNILSGLGEIYKYSILDKNVFNILSKEKDVNLSHELIYACLRYKAEIVEKDLYEKHERMLLNLGHTLGHAYETLSKYKLSHGECVAMGINNIAKLSNKKGLLSDDDFKKIEKLSKKFKFKLSRINFNIEDCISVIKQDKKMLYDNNINTVLIKGIGDCIIKKIDVNEFKEI